MGGTRTAAPLARVLLRGTDPGRLRIGKRTPLGIEFTSFIRESAFLFHDANDNSPSPIHGVPPKNQHPDDAYKRDRRPLPRRRRRGGYLVGALCNDFLVINAK
ncbi:hypothetical protein [Corynebacterium macginleyi]